MVSITRAFKELTIFISCQNIFVGTGKPQKSFSQLFITITDENCPDYSIWQ